MSVDAEVVEVFTGTIMPTGRVCTYGTVDGHLRFKFPAGSSGGVRGNDDGGVCSMTLSIVCAEPPHPLQQGVESPLMYTSGLEQDPLCHRLIFEIDLMSIYD
jgi:hypothetical protein